MKFTEGSFAVGAVSKLESNCSMTRKYSSKGVCFSDLICIFAMSIVGFSCFLFATLRQINPSTWQNPGPLGQPKNFLLLRRLKSLIYNSVAELRTYTLS